MAGAIKLNKSNAAQSRALKAGPPNMHLLSLQKLAQRTRSDRWEQYERLAAPGPGQWQPFSARPEWSATTRLLFDASGFDFNGPPARRPRPTLRITGDPEAVVNVRDLLDEEETEEPVSLSFAPGPIVWDDLDEADALVEEPSTLAFDTFEIYEPPEPEVLEKAPAAVEPSRPLKQPPAVKLAEETLEHVLLAPAEEEIIEQPPAEPVLEKVEVAMAPPPDLEPPPLRPLEVPAPTLHAEPLVATGARLQLPSVESEPLRPKLVRDAPPAPPTPPAAEQKIDNNVETKPAPVAPPPQAIVEAPVTAPAPPQTIAAKDPTRKNKKKKRPQDDSPIEEPADLGEDVEAGLRPAPVATKKSSPAPITADSSSSGLPGFADPAMEPVPGNNGMKVGLAVLALALAGGGAYFFMGSSSSTAAKPKSAQSAAFREVVTAGPVMGEVGWSSDYATDTSGRRLRQISLYRPTVPVADYRVEFQGEVESKALSWVVRGASTKSYYVFKIVPDKGNVAKLVRFAVVNGQADAPVTKDLPFPASLGTTYRVRADVVGSQFSVTIQDKKIDQWTETRLPAGGFGVANEGIERGTVRNIQVWHLREAATR